MVMSINNLMAPEGPTLYYDPAFRLMLESHMSYLRQRPSIRVLDIDNHDAYKYEGDLAGLLRKYSIPPHLHWVIMRLNDMDSPALYTADMTQLIILPETEIKSLAAVFRTSNKKIA